MQFQRLLSFDEISEDEWNQLLQKSDSRSPFLLYGFQQAWWNHLGGGEWKDVELCIITARVEGVLAGIAPLFLGTKKEKKEIHFIGSFEISDYLDFITVPNKAEEFIRGIFAQLEADFSAPLPEIILYNISDESPTLQALASISSQTDWDIQIERAYHTPAISLANDWDTYLAGINKKQRHEIRRKIRRAENAEEDSVSWHIVKSTDGLESTIQDFFELMEYDPEKKRFLTASMRQQMSAIIHWAAEEGILQLSFLTINDKNAAAYFCFDFEDRLWVYNSGFHPDFQYYSPGWVLLSYLIQHAIETEKTYFDFMRGDENYKYRFGAEDSFVMKAVAIKR